MTISDLRYMKMYSGQNELKAGLQQRKACIDDKKR